VMKRVAFDMDDVICTRKSEEGGVLKYHTCEPISAGVRLVNECFDAGYHVAIFTARGMISCDADIDRINVEIRPITECQLKDWGVRYHELIMGKYPYDVLICDKAVDSRGVRTLDDIKRALARPEPIHLGYGSTKDHCDQFRDALEKYGVMPGEK